jgi:hypothetical protein
LRPARGGHDQKGRLAHPLVSARHHQRRRHEGRTGAYRTVPKRDLVGAVMAVTHKERLHIARSLPETEALVKELRAFTARITTAGNERYENDWRVAPHDHIILALALALEHDRAGKRLGPESFYLPQL